MTNIDPLSTLNDEQLLMDYVICDDPDLLLLDAILSEVLS